VRGQGSLQINLVLCIGHGEFFFSHFQILKSFPTEGSIAEGLSILFRLAQVTSSVHLPGVDAIPLLPPISSNWV